MIVVADTSPLNYLVLINEIELLPALFQRVLLPKAVLAELQHPVTSAKVRQWVAQPPAWLEVHTAAPMTGPALVTLDPGEREAIQLALNLSISTLLLDEHKARQVAKALDLRVRGTLGILERGAQLGKTDFRTAFRRLEETSFRMSKAIRAEFLKRNP